MRSFLFILFFLLPLTLLSGMYSIATVLLVGITVIPLIQFLKCYSCRHNKRYKNRSLAFGFKSINAQIEGFKFINSLPFLPVVLRRFFKKLPVVNAPLFQILQCQKQEDFYGDPSYSSSMTNMWNRDKWKF